MENYVRTPCIEFLLSMSSSHPHKIRLTHPLREFSESVYALVFLEINQSRKLSDPVIYEMTIGFERRMNDDTRSSELLFDPFCVVDLEVCSDTINVWDVESLVVVYRYYMRMGELLVHRRNDPRGNSVMSDDDVRIDGWVHANRHRKTLILHLVDEERFLLNPERQDVDIELVLRESRQQMLHHPLRPGRKAREPAMNYSQNPDLPMGWNFLRTSLRDLRETSSTSQEPPSNFNRDGQFPSVRKNDVHRLPFDQLAAEVVPARILTNEAASAS
jgi:hypothetical protein